MKPQYQVEEFDYLLLLNIPVPIVTDCGETLSIKTPSLEKYYTSLIYRKLEALLLVDLEKDIVSQPEKIGFVADSLSDIFIGLAIQGEDKILKEFEEVSGCKVDKKGISFNGVEITEKDILEIRAVLLTATGQMSLDGETQEEKEEDEFDKRLREMENKINKIKKETETEGTIPYKELMLFVIYELGSSAEEIKNLNHYGVREMYNFASMASIDKIRKIAAGNGNLGDTPYKGILSD